MKLPIGGCERSIRRAAQFTAPASATSAAVEPSAIRAPRLPQLRPSPWRCPESRRSPLVGRFSVESASEHALRALAARCSRERQILAVGFLDRWGAGPRLRTPLRYERF